MSGLRATNDPEYRAMKQILRGTWIKCWHDACTERATSPDHDPPVSHHHHIRGSGCCRLRPCCLPHQKQQGAAITNRRRASGYTW